MRRILWGAGMLVVLYVSGFVVRHPGPPVNSLSEADTGFVIKMRCNGGPEASLNAVVKLDGPRLVIVGSGAAFLPNGSTTPWEFSPRSLEISDAETASAFATIARNFDLCVRESRDPVVVFAGAVATVECRAGIGSPTLRMLYYASREDQSFPLQMEQLCEVVQKLVTSDALSRPDEARKATEQLRICAQKLATQLEDKRAADKGLIPADAVTAER